MAIIRAELNDQVMIITDRPKIASGDSGGEDKVHFTFDSTWDGFTVNATFFQDVNNAYTVEIDQNGYAVIPAGAVYKPGIMFFGVVGINGSDTKTGQVKKYRIIPGTPGGNPPVPGQSYSYASLINKPQINGHELIGNKTGTDLGLADGSRVTAIEGKIPSQASSSNKLADKAFVNSSIATNTANYISNNGNPFTSLAQLQAYSGTVTNNDYAFITGTDSGNSYYDRYKATVNGSTVTWAKEYRLNNSSFTANQWAAISSGITSALVGRINTLTDTYINGLIDAKITNAIGGAY